MEGLPGPAARSAGRRRGRGRLLSENRRVVLWRHGQTEWNAQRRFQGQTDVDLDDVGRAQAARAARMLAGLSPSRIIASDLRRAVDTAAELATLTGLTVTTDRGLRETDAGEWEGLTDPEIRARFPGEIEAWHAGEDVPRGGGETMVDVAKRACAVIEEAVAGMPADSTLIVVTHGGAARVTIGTLLGLTRPQWRALGPVANCSWSVLGETAHGWRLLEHNAGSLPEPVLGDDR